MTWMRTFLEEKFQLGLRDAAFQPVFLHLVPMIAYLLWRYDRPQGGDDTRTEDLAEHCGGWSR
jgi:hypothetical protein